MSRDGYVAGKSHQHYQADGVEVEQADQRCHDAADSEPGRGDGSVMRGARGQRAADQHTDRIHGQKTRQRHIGDVD
jgi:hypothetical protein